MGSEGYSRNASWEKDVQLPTVWFICRKESNMWQTFCTFTVLQLEVIINKLSMYFARAHKVMNRIDYNYL